MEPPTPQCVGREFVRQYYTLLNKAPLHLHRFYNSHSSFVHGGIDGGTDAEEVRGQQQIHEKIIQLNFNDCHAKIRKVDSHKTLGDGVVVQVSGELSNNGQPMRRFVQTFVLAPQSPKKYYVHNDIFRYQDEVFTDVESEGTTTITTEEQVGRLEKPIQEQILAAAQSTKAQAAAQAQIQPQVQEPIKPEPPVVQQDTYTQEPHVNGVGYSGSPTVVEQPPAMEVEEEAAAAVWKGAAEVVEVDVMEEDEVVVEPQPQQQQPTPPTPQAPAAQQQAIQAELALAAATAPSNAHPMSYRDRVLASTGKPPMAPATGGAANNVGGAAAAVKEAATYQQQATATAPQQQQNATAAAGGPKVFRARESSRGRSSTGGGGSGGGAVTDRRSGQNDRYPQGGNSRDMDGEGAGTGGRQRMTSNAGDQYQLFVGNLPHTCSEADLRELFVKFGQVTDVRINSKKTNRQPGSNPKFTVPNYGFVVFDDINAVEAAMASQPILLHGSHRLNIEEKKSREIKSRESMGGGGKADNMDRQRDGGGQSASFDRQGDRRGDRGSQDNLRSAGGGHAGGGRAGGDRGRGMGGARGGRGGGGRQDFGSRGGRGDASRPAGFRGGGGPRN